MLDLKIRPFYLNEEQEKWVYDTLHKLTTEEKAGQLFCVMGGDYTPEVLKELVAKSRVGGILFRPAPAEEIRANYKSLDEVAAIPLLKAANLEEGGSGGFSEGTLFGWPMTVAATDDETMVEKFAKVCALEGESVGINWTFSPVCDLDLNFRNPITNVRTFGSDRERVLKDTEIYVKTVQQCGMAACAKHFPGDGVDYRDQHLHPTYNSLSAQDWYGSYGAIYQNLIAHDLLSIMAGHIVQPNVAMDINPELTLEECLPASMSRELLTGVLRKKFGFHGVITTDATIMGGYCMAMERRKAIPASIMAGCDMLVFNTDLEEDYGYVLEGLRNGLLTEERLDEAVTRILALKAKVCAMEKSGEEIPAKKWQEECAQKAVTLVKNLSPQVLPVTKDKYESIRLIILGKDDILDGSITALAKAAFEEYGYPVEVYEPYADELHGTGKLSRKRLTVYFANYEQASNQTTVRIDWCKKHALDGPRFLNEEDCIFVSLANPYLLQDVPRIKTYINAYTATGAAIRAVVSKLMGESSFTGVSPVDPFCGLIDTRL
ncbi:MAG: glycoside hydrolase family 3 protein [Lachnospiraceae bacterium]